MQKLIEYAEVSLNKVMTEGSDTHVNHWTAPVWQLDKLNLNGRLYSTKLAQRIVAEAAKTGVFIEEGYKLMPRFLGKE